MTETEQIHMQRVTDFARHPRILQPSSMSQMKTSVYAHIMYLVACECHVLRAEVACEYLILTNVVSCEYHVLRAEFPREYHALRTAVSCEFHVFRAEVPCKYRVLRTVMPL